MSHDHVDCSMFQYNCGFRSITYLVLLGVGTFAGQNVSSETLNSAEPLAKSVWVVLFVFPPLKRKQLMSFEFPVLVLDLTWWHLRLNRTRVPSTCVCRLRVRRWRDAVRRLARRPSPARRPLARWTRAETHVGVPTTDRTLTQSPAAKVRHFACKTTHT